MGGTSTLLLRRAEPLPEDEVLAAEARARFAGRGRLALRVSLDGSLAYAYCWTSGEPGLAPGLERLSLLADLAGRSAGRPARFHYVVEIDAAPGWEDELERWYAEEHLPALAAVPGCARAGRLRNLDGTPRSHAFYELESPEVLQTPAWLAVRGSAWSGRIRPQFRNARRTMFRKVGEDG